MKNPCVHNQFTDSPSAYRQLLIDIPHFWIKRTVLNALLMKLNVITELLNVNSITVVLNEGLLPEFLFFILLNKSLKSGWALNL